MTIQFSGLGSGLEINTWIESLVEIKSQPLETYNTELETAQTKKEAFATMKTLYNTLRTKAEVFTDCAYGQNKDIFANNIATSSNESVFTATATSAATRQSYNIVVNQLATKTTVESTKNPMTLVDGSTLFKDINSEQGTSGTFSVYINNERKTIEIKDTDTIDDIIKKLNDLDSTVSASIEDGIFSIKSTKNIQLGSTSDTSNFGVIMGLRKVDGENEYQSLNPVTQINLKKPLVSLSSGFSTGEINEDTGENGTITAGTFKIGNATFTIDETTTMSSLINKINSTKEAGASAYFNSTTGKIVITSATEGSINLNIEAGTSNFTEVFGLTENGALAEGSQTLGQNAKIEIDGVQIESLSNTITSEASGIVGLTLNLKSVSEEGKETSLKIARDNSSIVSAVKEFIDAYNTVINASDKATAAEDGVLAYETGVTAIRNDVKNIASSSIGRSLQYSTLASIGIYTVKPGADTSADTTTLNFDEEAFLAALEDNDEQVKSIFVSNTSVVGSSGIMNQIKDRLDIALDTTKGYFVTMDSSMDSKIELINDKITRKQAEIDAYEEMITRQFNAMDEAIGKMKNQYSNISSLIGSLDSSSSS